MADGSIVQTSSDVQRNLRERLLLPVRILLPERLVEGWCRDAGLRWRNRHFGVVVALLSCIYKHLQCVSARNVEDCLASLCGLNSGRDGHDFCNARRRLPVLVFQKALRHLAGAAAEHWRGLRVCFVDGTTAALPRSAHNIRAFGCGCNQHGSSHFPLLRQVLLTCGGAILDLSIAAYATGELRMFCAMLLRLAPESLIVGDKLYGCYLALALARSCQSHMLSATSRNRRPLPLRRINEHEWIETWRAPRSDHTILPHLLKRCAATLEVRIIQAKIERKGYRPYTLTLCTTLLDHAQHPAKELVSLYLRRWRIEQNIRDLKHVHGINRLSAKTPGIVYREIYSAALAFNCARALMVRSGTAVPKCSHTRCVRLILCTADAMSFAATELLPSCYNRMIMLIATAHLPNQERPPEPRALVIRRRRYPYLKVTRQQWRDSA